MAKSNRRPKRRSNSRARPSRAQAEQTTPDPPSPQRSLVSNAALFAALGVLVGAGAGWLLRDSRSDDSPATGATAAPSAPTAAPDRSACKTWAKGICDGVGTQTGDCRQAQAASLLIPPKACTVALAEVAATVAMLKKGRVVCDELATQLCKDVGGNSPKTCTMIKERFAGMPTTACEERRQNYPLLLNQLKQLANPQRARRPGGPPVGPDGAPTPGGNPHGPNDGHAH